MNPAFAMQKDFFQLKELEKLGPKMKGIGKIAQQALKRIPYNWLQSLSL